MFKHLFKEYFGVEADKIVAIAGAGSNRRYYRLTSTEGQSAIAVVGTSRDENNAFIYLARHLRGKGLPVPQLYAVANDGTSYLQEDLGSTSLFDAIAEGRQSGGHYSEKEQSLIEKTIRLLPKIQCRGAENIDWKKCYPNAAMDYRCAMFDLNYFKYCFLKATEVDFSETNLEDDFCKLATTVSQESDSRFFLYRDFQARNIMLKDEEREPYFIDFQGARRGSMYYDVASFLWQASARYDDALRLRMIRAYCQEMSRLVEMPSEDYFMQKLYQFVLFRMLQVLGAYGFRGYFERKPHFLKSILPAIESIGRLIRRGVADNYPELKSTLLRLVEKQANVAELQRHDNKAEQRKLVVRIFSFSYKKGIPEDTTGNGGGYVFDCRSTHNPGRYERYKQLTGLDRPVREFLETDGEILTFLESVAALADHHVERYIERGFTELMFAFGCTGGQHRSVYCADWLAHHLNDKYGIEVKLCHREQNINTTLLCKQ